MKKCVVIPAHNETRYIQDVLKNVKKYVRDVIVVDDGSTDETAILAEKDATVLSHIINLGKGAALKTGCDYALQHGYTHIVVMDADGQHDPKFIPKFINGLSHADLVLGYREFDTKMPGILRLGNWGIDWLTKTLHHINVPDTQSGFRAFSAKAYKKLRWKSRGYSMESEMLARAGKHHITYKTIPISTIYSDRYKGTTVLDGIKIGFNIIKWKIFPL